MVVCYVCVNLSCVVTVTEFSAVFLLTCHTCLPIKRRQFAVWARFHQHFSGKNRLNFCGDAYMRTFHFFCTCICSVVTRTCVTVCFVNWRRITRTWWLWQASIRRCCQLVIYSQTVCVKYHLQLLIFLSKAQSISVHSFHAQNSSVIKRSVIIH